MRLNPNGTPYTGGSWGVNGQIIYDAQADDDVAYGVEEITEGGTNYLIVCGTTTTDHFNPGGAKNNNAWVGKLNLDGTWATGWSSRTEKGKQYGGTGKDVGYDIKQDVVGYYVVAGTASAGNNDVPSACHSDGDYWVFKINSSGTLAPAIQRFTMEVLQAVVMIMHRAW